jgi:nucleoside-diphosphate-sugar epimerase
VRSMSKLFITGGTGFIGSHVVKLLVEMGHEVTIYDAFVSYIYPLDRIYVYNVAKRMEQIKDQVQIVRGSTDDQGYLRRALMVCNPDYIVHLAGLPLANMAMNRPEEATKSIMSGTMNLLEASRDLNNLQRLVYISSSMVYGDFIKVPAGEDHPADPKELYGSMKLSGEIVTRAFSRLYGIDYAIVRPSAVYGPTDNNRRVISIFVENAINGKTLVVKGADQSLDFTYVTDTAKGIVQSTFHPAASKKTFNITRGQGRTIKEVAEILDRLVPGVKIEIESADKNLPTRGTLDISSARTRIDYSPEINLEDGLERYVKFIQTRKEEIGE